MSKKVKVTSLESLSLALEYMQRFGNFKTVTESRIYGILKDAYKDKTKEDFDESRFPREPKAMIAADCITLAEALSYAIGWQATDYYELLHKYIDAIGDRCDKLEKKAMKEYKKASVPIGKAEKMVEEFMNSPHINALPIQRQGIVKAKGQSSHMIPETFGALSKDDTARAYLDEDQPYQYMSRMEALINWFSSEISFYYQHLLGEKVAEELEDADTLDFVSLLEGMGRSNKYETSDIAWGRGESCTVSLTGETIPGVVLRVYPVQFKEDEIIYFANKIVKTQQRAQDTMDNRNQQSTSDLEYSKNIIVSLTSLRQENLGLLTETGPYDISLLNIKPTGQEIVDRIVSIMQKPTEDRPTAITGLFYGVPGTGKSMLANHIGRTLGMTVLKKTYGELQSMYVGEGEKNLHDAFEEARQKRAILLIDEIDSMAGNRQDADKNYQKTFTNQLLTELDEFNGIFFATSNLMTTLDPAVLRRLFLKTKFGFMTPEQIEKCFHLYFPKFEGQKLGMTLNLTPGDFNAVQQASLFEPKRLTVKKVRKLLQQEVALKSLTMPDVIQSDMDSSFLF